MVSIFFFFFFFLFLERVSGFLFLMFLFFLEYVHDMARLHTLTVDVSCCCSIRILKKKKK